MILNTIVVPGHPENCKSYFINEGYWDGVTFKRSFLTDLKFIAVYETKPCSAIRYYAEIQSVESYIDIKEKYRIYIKKESIKKLDNPIKITTPTDGIQRSRFTSFQKLMAAKTMHDVF